MTINKMRQIKKGDWIIAAFRNRRFGGYGQLQSDFYRSKKSLKITRPDDQTQYPFEERFMCDWFFIPINAEPPYVDLTDSKGNAKSYKDMALHRGLCVKQIHEKTFDLIKTRLSQAGARKAKISKLPVDEAAEMEAVMDMDLKEQEYFEGKKQAKYSVKYERDPALRKMSIYIHSTECMVCGFDFQKKYGVRGNGFIEVHHKKPVSTLKKDTKINPQKDMAVVCSNCHRIIHRKKDDVYDIKKMQKLLIK